MDETLDLDYVGANVEIGFDWSEGLGTIFQAAGGLTQGVTSIVEKEQAKAKAATEEKAAIEASVRADLAAAVALQRATLSEALKGASAGIDRTAADLAVSAADRAGAKLSAGAQEARADAANRNRAAAISAAQASPKDASKKALVDAWTRLINKAQAGAIVASEKGPAEPPPPKSFLTKPLIGPVPGWAVGAGGVGLLAYLAKRFL